MSRACAARRAGGSRPTTRSRSTTRNRRIEFQTIAGPVRPHGVYEFTEADGGTRLSFSLDAKISGLRGLVMGSAVQQTMDSEVRTLDNLKGVLETSSA